MLGRIVLFAREPSAGKVKTRLARSIGDVAATGLYRAILADLSREAGQIPLPREVRYEAEGDPTELRLLFPSPWALVPQGPGNLSDRLTRAARAAFGAVPAVVICGTDAPLLQACHIESALAALEEVEVVLSPARDGGFSLIGLSRTAAVDLLFAEIPWSTSNAREAVVERAERLGLRARLLQPVHDIDEREDLDHLVRDLATASPGTAPETRAWLASWKAT